LDYDVVAAVINIDETISTVALNPLIRYLIAVFVKEQYVQRQRFIVSTRRLCDFDIAVNDVLDI